MSEAEVSLAPPWHEEAFGDELLLELADLEAGPTGLEERAQRLVRLLASGRLTCALRWWRGERVVSLASAGPGYTAVMTPLPEALLQQVRRGEPVSLPELGLAEAVDETWVRVMVGSGLRAALLVPLAVATEVKGALTLFGPGPEAWAEVPEERMLLVGRLAGLWLTVDDPEAGGRPRIPAALDDASREAVAELHGNEDPAGAAERAVTQVQRVLKPDWLLVARLNAEYGCYDCHLDHDVLSLRPQEAPLVHEVATSRSAVEGLPADEADDALAQRLRAAGVTALRSLPLEFQNEIFGVLQLGYRDPERLTESVRQISGRMSFHIGLALRDADLKQGHREALSQLRQAQQEATEGAKLRALAQMAGGVAHEFNNALGGILGRAQMLQQQTKDHRVLKGLNTILEIGWRAAETVRRLQEFTRERSEEDFQPVLVENLWQRVTEVARHRVDEYSRGSGTRYHLELEHETLSGVLLANPEELAEAVGNVVLNAVEATAGGGVVTLHAHTAADHLHLTVVDRGRGMSTEEQQSIFDPFYSTKAETGVGLGLSVTYGIISRHRGEIEVESEPQVGTTVRVTLPLSGGAVQVRSDTPHILVIDDEAPLCEVLAELFSSMGYTVETCAGGREGIERFQGKAFDLVCTDLRTEDISGWEVIRAVKEHRPHIPVILVTGFRDQLRQDQIEDSRVDAVMGKPFSLQQVSSEVERLLGGAKS